MISQARKRVVKQFNRRLKKATGLEKETLLTFAQQAGLTAGGNLSTRAVASTQTIKSFANGRKNELSSKLKKYENPQPRKKLTLRERLEREQHFRERHGLQYTSIYQQAQRILDNPLASENQLKKYAQHAKIGGPEFEQQRLESLIEKIRYFAYKEENLNADAGRFIDLLDNGLGKLDNNELNKITDEIYKRNKNVIDDYEQDLEIGGISIISLARD